MADSYAFLLLFVWFEGGDKFGVCDGFFFWYLFAWDEEDCVGFDEPAEFVGPTLEPFLFVRAFDEVGVLQDFAGLIVDYCVDGMSRMVAEGWIGRLVRG